MQYRSWLVFDIEHSHSIVVSLSLSLSLQYVVN